MDALDFLARLKIIPKIIENCEIQKQWWEDKAKNSSAGGVTVKLLNKKGEEELHNMEKVQSSACGDPMAVAVINYVDIERKIDALKVEQRKAEAILESLKPNEYEVLYKYEIFDFKLYEIADKLNISYSSATKLHKKALKNLQKTLDKAKL